MYLLPIYEIYFCTFPNFKALKSSIYDYRRTENPLHNCRMRGLTQNKENETDVIHRRQLHFIINDRKISNQKLYEKCNKKPMAGLPKSRSGNCWDSFCVYPMKNQLQASKYFLQAPSNS